MRNGSGPPVKSFLKIFWWKTGQKARKIAFTLKNTRDRGVGCVKKFNVNVSTEKIKKYLMDKIDSSNPVEVEKVGRYLSLIDMHRRMSRTVKKEGESTKVVNGSQEYIKAHPLLSEMNKVNASLLSIEKSFVFIEPVNEDEEIELI